ncbi:hypothetical protein LN42_03945 [Marinitoga sp. 1137]|uniref:hypothetical protein n=1 Tax=Marinitoga sp. 1137 TaxID=1545835 RepID=UPI0009507DE8|nr:hypothetical protein [Marinitoga sp. 1137]APT75637.1 hypothetical protein LN42_03945 [Marinitoga sp. 1137]
MKKYIWLIIFSILVVNVFSLNLNEIKTYYVEYIDKYNSHSEDLNWFFTEMKNMGLYKFYKSQMVGSAEYTDRPSYISKHLSSIASQHKFDSLEQEIAFSGFLSYVQNVLAGKDMSEESIRSLPAFYLAMEEYSSYLQDTGFLYIKNTIAYSLGLVKDSPNKTLTKRRMKNRNAELEFPEYYTYEGKPDAFFDKIIEENKDVLNEGILEISKTRLTGEDLEIEIDDLASKVLSFVPETIKNDTKAVIDIFLDNAKIERSNDWIRFAVYAGLIILILLLKKKDLFQWLFLGIVLVESVYIIKYFDFTKDITTAFIYGSFFVVFFAMILITMFFQAFGRNMHWLRRVINVSLLVLILLIVNVPLVKDVKEVRMDENPDFHNSIMQKALLNDVLLFPHAFVNKDIAFIGSQLSAEYSEARNIYTISLKKFLVDSGKKKILDYVNFEDGKASIDILKQGLYYDNKDVYNEIFSNYKKALEEFERNSKIRQKDIDSRLKEYNAHMKNILIYSDDVFANTLKSNIESKMIKTNVLKDYKANLLNVFSEEKAIPIDLKALISDWGTKVMLLLILGFIYFFVNEKIMFKLVGLGIMTVASILAFIKPGTIEVLSEFKYPVLNATMFSVNTTFGMLMLLFTALSGLLILNFHKGR